MEAPVQPAAAMPCRHALIVDDSSVERMLATAVLRKLGFVAFCAGSAEEALALLGHHSVDLVVCDIALPGMDGLTLLAALRTLPVPPGCIILSAHDDPLHALTARRCGAGAYLIKPLRLAGMRDAINAIFGARQNLPGPEQASAALADMHAGRCQADGSRLNHTVRRMVGAVARPVRSAAAALLPAKIRATG